jgi:hypothetical protein
MPLRSWWASSRRISGRRARIFWKQSDGTLVLSRVRYCSSRSDGSTRAAIVRKDDSSLKVRRGMWSCSSFANMNWEERKGRNCGVSQSGREAVVPIERRKGVEWRTWKME